MSNERYRTRGTNQNILTRSDTWRVKLKGSPETITNTNYTYLGDHDYEEMWDTITPNYKKRVRSGEVIINFATYIRRLRNVPDNHSVLWSPLNSGYDSWSRVGNANWTAVFAESQNRPPVYVLPASTVLSESAVMAKAVANVDPSTYDMMEDMLTMKQTFQSLGGPLEAWHGVMKNWRKKQNRYTASELWLRYRFEILPLYHSVTGLIAGAQGPMDRLNAGVLLRASASDKGVAAFNSTAWNALNTEQYLVNHHVDAKRKCVVFYTLRNSRAGIAHTFGTRLKDVPKGLWNVVTLSFMIDRVVDVSSYIQAVVNLSDHNIQYKGACSTLTTETTVVKQLLLHKYDAGSTYPVSGNPLTEYEKKIVRSPSSPYTALSPSALSLRPSGLISNATRALDLITLIHTIFSRSRR